MVAAQQNRETLESPRPQEPMTKGWRWRRGLAEGGIILASVLGAFWVDAAWERSQDRELEEAILVAVSEEIEANRTNVLQAIQNTDVRLARIDRWLAIDAASASLIAQDSLLDLVTALPNVPQYLPVHSAVTMLMQTPVRDQAGIEARRLVDDYLRAWGSVESMHEALRSRRDEVQDALAPFGVRGVGSGPGRAALTDDAVPVLLFMIARQGVPVFMELRQDERVVSAVLLKAHWQDVYRMELGIVLETLDSLDGALDER